MFTLTTFGCGVAAPEAANTSGTGGMLAAGSGGVVDNTAGTNLTAGTASVGGNGGSAGTTEASAGTGQNDIGGGSVGGGGAGGGSSLPDPGTEGDGDFMIASPFKTAPEMSDRPATAKGQVVRFSMGNSTTFGDGSRNVGVYVPNGYVSGAEAPFMVAQDGIGAQNGGSFGLDDLRPLLDNMIADGRLPAMAAVFVDPAGMRSVEYDTVSDKYYQFVETELLPEAIKQVQSKTSLTLNLTKDPEGRATFGGSSGGAAAFTMAWFHPESYRRVLTISGTFVGLQKSAAYPDGAAGYPMKLVPESEPKPLRVFLEAGTNDLGGGRWETANIAMAKALKDKAYHYRYIHAQGAGHEDNGARRQYLPEAMTWLWRGYPLKK
jgi:enterochelin esterase-like enzyme